LDGLRGPSNLLRATARQIAEQVDDPTAIRIIGMGIVHGRAINAPSPAFASLGHFSRGRGVILPLGGSAAPKGLAEEGIGILHP